MPAPLRKTTAAPAFAGATAVIGRNPPFSPVAANPLLHHRCDLLAPFAAVEDAVMADALRHQIFLLGRRQRLGERQRRLGLADSRYIVALDRKSTRMNSSH